MRCPVKRGNPAFAENGDWLRGASRCSISRNVTATVPVPFFRSLLGLQGFRTAENGYHYVYHGDYLSAMRRRVRCDAVRV